jgi:hypothetical protein
MKLQLRDVPNTRPTVTMDPVQQMAHRFTEIKAIEIRAKRPELTPEQAYVRAMNQLSPEIKRALIGGER